MDLFNRKRIKALEEANRNLNRRLEDWENRNRKLLETIDLNVKTSNRALGRIIAKLDPMYHISEFDPTRRAESDRLSDEIISKLLAEHQMSNRLPK